MNGSESLGHRAMSLHDRLPQQNIPTLLRDWNTSGSSKMGSFLRRAAEELPKAKPPEREFASRVSQQCVAPRKSFPAKTSRCPNSLSVEASSRFAWGKKPLARND